MVLTRSPLDYKENNNSNAWTSAFPSGFGGGGSGGAWGAGSSGQAAAKPKMASASGFGGANSAIPSFQPQVPPALGKLPGFEPPTPSAPLPPPSGSGSWDAVRSRMPNQAHWSDADFANVTGQMLGGAAGPQPAPSGQVPFTPFRGPEGGFHGPDGATFTGMAGWRLPNGLPAPNAPLTVAF